MQLIVMILHPLQDLTLFTRHPHDPVPHGSLPLPCNILVLLQKLLHIHQQRLTLLLRPLQITLVINAQLAECTYNVLERDGELGYFVAEIPVFGWGRAVFSHDPGSEGRDGDEVTEAEAKTHGSEICRDSGFATSASLRLCLAMAEAMMMVVMVMM
jgi:hypothetical protein